VDTYIQKDHVCFKANIIIDDARSCLILPTSEEVGYDPELVVKDLCELLEIKYEKESLDTLDELITTISKRHGVVPYNVRALSELYLYLGKLPRSVITMWYEEIRKSQPTS